MPAIVKKGRDWVQNRVDVESIIQAALHVEIPQGVRTYFLGGTTLFFLGVQVTTGILLALYPPLLSIIVATLLIAAGVLVITLVRNERRLQRHHENPTIEFFLRY